MSKLIPVAVLFGFLLVACNYPGLQEQTEKDGLATSAAETVSAQLTLVSATQPVVEPTEPQGLAPTATATIELQPTDSPPPDCTNEVGFVQDVTVPDDTNIPAGDTFDKIWRLRNEGTCTWTVEYDVIFDGGKIMAGPPSAPLPSTVPPGSTVDIEVSLTAPGADGTHRGDWKLRTPDGVVFGLGDDGETPFFVQIIVGAQAPELVYDFVEKYCDATWRTGAGELSCPGTDSDAEGFVLKLNSPKLEDGRTENEPALFTHPQWINNGVISGRFPAFEVEQGDEFHAVIGCLFNALACNVTMQLNYRENGGDLRQLREWDETYDGDFRILEVDLSSLAGSSVEFVLAVQSNGAFSEDWAFWLAPRIIGVPR
ncbi:MAG: hypothetical protein BMS9Abin28_1456 [Anaerolineae bacterium]|nr:MAG: hypothetical protein BMS9Abin28_1456 [Anaerolineae bacterium]